MARSVELLLDRDYPFFIAEIGKNFIDVEREQTVDECLEKAKALVVAAKNAGADAVKFQTHCVEDEIAKLEFTSPHFTGVDRYTWVKKNELLTPDDEFFIPLKKFCDEVGVTFFSTPMSKGAALRLKKLNVPFWKIGSADVGDFVLGECIVQDRLPVIISTGMVSYDDLVSVVKFYDSRSIPLVILYCVSEYPCPPESFNLASITKLQQLFPKHVVGFSDHSIDSHDAVLASTSLGASVIEKHFTFSREAWGSDHKASLLPSEFREMVDLVRSGYGQIDATAFCGDLDAELPGATNKYKPFFLKSLVLARNVKKGEVVTMSDLLALRPYGELGGLRAMEAENLVGRQYASDIPQGTVLTLDHFGAL